MQEERRQQRQKLTGEDYNSSGDAGQIESSISIDRVHWNLNPESGLFNPLQENAFKAIDNTVSEHFLKIDPGMTPDMAQSLIDLSSRVAQTAPPPQIIAQLEKAHIHMSLEKLYYLTMKKQLIPYRTLNLLIQ